MKFRNISIPNAGAADGFICAEAAAEGTGNPLWTESLFLIVIVRHLWNFSNMPETGYLNWHNTFQEDDNLTDLKYIVRILASILTFCI